MTQKQITNKAELLKKISGSFENLKYASEELLNDREIGIEAVKKNGKALKLLGQSLKEDVDIVRIATEGDWRNMEFAGPEIRSNKEFIIEIANRNSRAIDFASSALKDDPEIAAIAIKHNYFDFIKNCSEVIKSNKELMLSLVAKNGEMLQSVSEGLKSDYDVVLAAVLSEPKALRFANREFKADKDIVLALVSKNSYVLNYASDNLLDDKDIILAAISTNGDLLGLAGETLRADREIVMAAVLENGEALQYASDELRADREIVSTSIKNNLNAFEYSLLWDDDIIELAAKEWGPYFIDAQPYGDDVWILSLIVKYFIGWESLYDEDDKYSFEQEFILWTVKYALEIYGEKTLNHSLDQLINDKNIYLKLIMNSPEDDGICNIFYRAGTDVINDPEVVKAAVKKSGIVIEFVPDRFCNDREIVLAAVTQNGLALKFASDELKADREVVLTAINENGFALNYASEALQDDEKLRKLASKSYR